MTTLILVFCLIGAPGECREIQPSLEPMGLHECLFAGQLEGARWLDEHPKWQLARVKCQIGKKLEPNRGFRERAI